MFVPRRSFTEQQLREAIAASTSYAQTLRSIGLRPAGGNTATLKKYVALWDISVDHFGPGGGYPRGGIEPTPLAEVLVEHSGYHRGGLKRRLYESGLKQPECELCGQDENWRGRRMALILDHINGVATDNRLDNLRIVCPNCNATLETHCGRNKPRGRPPRSCAQCEEFFRPTHAAQRFCSRVCSTACNAPLRRVVERPAVDELRELVLSVGYRAAGRQLGVSDNAIRKWFRAYGVEPPPARGRELHPPPPAAPALTDDAARQALRMIAGGRSMYAVARDLGVSQTTIHDLRHGRTYRHLERPPELDEAA